MNHLMIGSPVQLPQWWEITPRVGWVCGSLGYGQYIVAFPFSNRWPRGCNPYYLDHIKFQLWKKQFDFTCFHQTDLAPLAEGYLL